MSKIKKALIKCDDGVRSSIARWETPQHGRTTELDHPMELQADRTEIAQTGPPEVAAPLYTAERCLKLHNEIDGAHGAYIRCAKRNGANLILSGLYDYLARLLGNSLLGE